MLILRNLTVLKLKIANLFNEPAQLFRSLQTEMSTPFSNRHAGFMMAATRTSSFVNKLVVIILLGTMPIVITGCITAGLPPAPNRLKHPSITSVPARPTDDCPASGMAFYLPKPLLVVSKNFHHINEHPYGMTVPAPIPGEFDDQSNYARLHNRSQVGHSMKTDEIIKDTGVPDIRGTEGADPKQGTATKLNQQLTVGTSPLSPGLGSPNDGLAPTTFFTYEVIFVPDLTQKYVLDVSGGAGEMRAALNFINGWQFTGLGPFYMKDSSTAQNLMAKGLAINLASQGVGDVLNSIGNLAKKAAPGGLFKSRDLLPYMKAVDALSKLETFDYTTIGHGTIERYAEIHVYEPSLEDDGTMHWRPIVGEFDTVLQALVGHRFQRTFLGEVRVKRDAKAVEAAKDLLPELLPPPNEGAGARALPADSGRSNDLSLLPTDESRQQLYQDLLKNTLVPPQPKEVTQKGGIGSLFRNGFGLFKKKRATLENRSVNIQQ